MRTLGDVPGIDLLPDSAILPASYTYTEVNPLGEVTAEGGILGDVSASTGSGDPFGYNIGFLDDPANDGETLGHVAQHDPMQSSYLPTYAGTPAVVPGPAAAGATTTGTIGNNPYGLAEIDGETVDNMTAAALKAAQKDWGGSGVHIMQGSFTTDVGASGNTHAGGGVIDIAPTDGDWAGLMTALRKVGFAAWIRNLPGYGQAGEGAHIHAVLMGDEKLSPEAAVQVQSYLNNDDGLSGSRPDDGPRQYVNNRFVWGKPRKDDPTWRDAITRAAGTYVGTPFKWGGEDYSGVDTEGLLRSVYSKLGVELPLVAEELKQLTDPIDIADARPGDLISWTDPREGQRFGVYLKGGRLIEAGGPGRVVQISELGADALGAFGIPIHDLLPGPARPTVQPAAPIAAAPLQGQAANPYNDTGPSRPPKHHNAPANTGAANPDKPHWNPWDG